MTIMAGSNKAKAMTMGVGQTETLLAGRLLRHSAKKSVPTGTDFYFFHSVILPASISTGSAFLKLRICFLLSRK